jgi:hypothetical protein
MIFQCQKTKTKFLIEITIYKVHNYSRIGKIYTYEVSNRRGQNNWRNKRGLNINKDVINNFMSKVGKNKNTEDKKLDTV